MKRRPWVNSGRIEKLNFVGSYTRFWAWYIVSGWVNNSFLFLLSVYYYLHGDITGRSSKVDNNYLCFIPKNMFRFITDIFVMCVLRIIQIVPLPNEWMNSVYISNYNLVENVYYVLTIVVFFIKQDINTFRKIVIL